MLVEKIGRRKWFVRGAEQAWAVEKTFSRKWKAILALEVLQNGGSSKDYREVVRMQQPKKKFPQNALRIIQAQYHRICNLNPTPVEIIAFGAAHEDLYGLVSITPQDGYFKPKIDNTWLRKWGGRVHIDIGAGGYHIMLDKFAAPDFVEFIEKSRS